MQARTIPLLVFAVLAGAAMSTACGDTGTPSSPAPPVNTGGGSSGTGGEMVKTYARLCDPLPQRGFEVIEHAMPSTPPEAAGGQIPTGTYVLVELKNYTGMPPAPSSPDDHNPPLAKTGRLGRATLYVTSMGLRFNEARVDNGGLPIEDTTRGYFYRVNGTNLELTQQCPQSSAKTSMPYAASGRFLSLIVDGKRREVYQRVR